MYLDLCLKSDWQQESVYLQETGASITLGIPPALPQPLLGLDQVTTSLSCPCPESQPILKVPSRWRFCFSNALA